MTNSQFWRTIAALLVLGLFYVGFALQQSGDVTGRLPAPSLVGEVRAEGVTAVPASGNYSKVITASSDGKTIYVWLTHTSIEESSVSFLGAYQAEAE
ncbi:MAG: hypothetical protein KY475_14485 [Planctomycetes bacterium]|nr:hypothetical protein [Planctomycetota bacterium]